MRLCSAALLTAVQLARPPAARVGMREGSSLTPRVDDALVAQVKQEIWRTSTTDDVAALACEQVEAVNKVLIEVEALVNKATVNADSPRGPADVAKSLSAEDLNLVVAPHLPLLMLRGYPAIAREALGKVRTVAQQTALLSLTQYMGGVYEEMATKLGDLQWQQLQKLRELCDAAMEARGGSCHRVWDSGEG